MPISTLGSRGPQWSPVELMCFFVPLFVYISLSLYVFTRSLLEIIKARPIIARSTCVCKRIVYAIFVFLLISSVWVQCRDVFIPTLGSKGTQWGLVELMCQFINYLCMSISMSDCPHLFLAIKAHGLQLCAAHAAVGHGVK